MNSMLNTIASQSLVNRILFMFSISFVLLPLNGLYPQWQQQAQLTGLGSFPRISVADSNTVWVAGGISNPRIYRSVNGGLNWLQIPVDGLPFFLTALAAKDSLTAFVADVAGSYSGGNAKFFKTTNAGQNWILIDSSGGTTGYFNDIQFSKSNPQVGIALCDPENGLGGPFNLYKTTNAGTAWVRTFPPGIPNHYGCYYSAFVTDNLFYGFIVIDAVPLYQHPYITINGGNSWYLVNDSMEISNSGDIAFSDNKMNGIMVSGYQMPVIKRTTDGGSNWSNVNTGPWGSPFSGACWVSGSNTAFIWGTNSPSGGIIRSDDNGSTWTAQNTASILNIKEMDYAVHGNRIVCYAVNTSGVILKSGQAFIPIGIQPLVNEIPDRFHLNQNYPNPFNPVTKLRFSLPGFSFVNLTVYDALGKEAAVLVSEELKAGVYEYEWNAANFPSGVYFCRFRAGEYSETKRMALIK